MYTHLLLTTDGSELARKGVDQGLALAKLFGAKVTLLSVTEPIALSDFNAARYSGTNPFTKYEEQMEAHFKAATDPVIARAGELGIAIEAVRESDKVPADAIVRTAKTRGADLIVMASHGRRGLQRVLLGSQTTEVLVRTEVPVLVVR